MVEKRMQEKYVARKRGCKFMEIRKLKNWKVIGVGDN